MTKVLAQETLVSSMLRTDSVLVEVGGNVRRISLENLMNAINTGNEQLLRQVAWGIPLKHKIQSSTYYGVVGNTAAWNEYKRMSGRYLVTNSGKASKLSPTNSSVFADGTALDETKGHVMFISPRLYYLVQTDSVTGIPYLWLSMLPIGGNYIGGANGGMYNCIGAYKGAMIGSTLVSRSGINIIGAKTINAFWSAAQVNGKDWGLTDYDQRKLIMMLGLSEYGDTNIQAKLGNGISGSSGLDLWTAAAALLTGATKSIGDNFGKIDISLVNGANTGVGCSRVNMMGIEDPYGWQWEMMQGVYCGSANNSAQNGSEIYIYKGNRLPTSAELTTHPNGEYRQATRQTVGGYVQEIIAGENFDIFPSKIGGGTTSYWADYSWANNTGQLVFWGGYAYNGAACGLAYASSSYDWSFSSAIVGSRLAYYGNLTFVTGADLMAP